MHFLAGGKIPLVIMVMMENHSARLVLANHMGLHSPQTTL
jgi:hypothetical protein